MLVINEKMYVKMTHFSLISWSDNEKIVKINSKIYSLVNKCLLKLIKNYFKYE